MSSSNSSASAWYNGTTPQGHNIPECSSALQKCVRRSKPDDAVYWAMQLYMAGYGKYVWKRLKIMVSEDVGLPTPALPANVYALHQMWEAQMQQKNDNANQAQVFIVHAVLLCATSPKSRLVDNMRLFHVETPEDAFREMPDEAVDKHTPAGKAAGRDLYHFIEVGSQIVAEGAPFGPEQEQECAERADRAMVKKWGEGAKDRPKGGWGRIVRKTHAGKKPAPPRPQQSLFDSGEAS